MIASVPYAVFEIDHTMVSLVFDGRNVAGLDQLRPTYGHYMNQVCSEGSVPLLNH